MEIGDIINLLKPELLVLIPTCWGIGMVVKSTKLSNNFIPLILCLSCIAITGLYVFANAEAENIALDLFMTITQGIIAWLISWITYEKGIKLLQNKDIGDGVNE